ncbi:MAG: thioesterase family protein [Desulfobacterales bacterium]
MHLFDQDISVTPKAPYFFKANVSDNWSINGNPNGGYLLAIVANAMMTHSDKTATPILTANYLARCLPGEAELGVEAIAQSKQFNRFQTRLLQEGSEKIRAFGTFAIETDECFIKHYETDPPEIAPLDQCVRFPQMPKYTLYDNMDVRLDPMCAGWMENKLSDKSEHKGWIKFTDNRPLDVLAVTLAADAFPPAVFSTQGMAAWVPTLEFTISIRNITDTERVKCRFRTRFINCGLLEEDGDIWDENDELIAVSRQIAQYRKIAG